MQPTGPNNAVTVGPNGRDDFGSLLSDPSNYTYLPLVLLGRQYLAYP